jgi:hypothetical protein
MGHPRTRYAIPDRNAPDRYQISMTGAVAFHCVSLSTACNAA